MKKLLVAIALAGLFCVPAFAQDVPKAEVYGGFQFLIDDPQPMGFTGAVEFNLNEKVGIVGQFGLLRKYGISTYEFVGGPRFGYRGDKVRVFFHALAGGFNTPYKTYFVVSPGGGLDININKNVAIRAAQVDALMFFQDDFEMDLQYSGGIVFKIGS